MLELEGKEFLKKRWLNYKKKCVDVSNVKYWYSCKFVYSIN